MNGGGAARQLAPTDEELDLRAKRAVVERTEHELAVERENRRQRRRVIRIMLVFMVLQIAAANGVFVWYGDTNNWHVPAAAISAWLGATAVQIVAVVLVIMRYLFYRPDPGRG